MNELSLLKAIGHNLPPIPHATAVVNRILKPLYLRKPREPVVTEAWGFRVLVNPSEAVDGGILFYPQLYNRTEFAWLRDHLQAGDTFADVGAYIGAFSLQASRLCRRVIAIEANPGVFATLIKNIGLNDLKIEAMNVGASDRLESMHLHLQTGGNLGGSSFVSGGDRLVEIQCRPLIDLAGRVDAMKIDVEGLELKVLTPYLAMHLPRMIIIETGGRETEALKLCLGRGYQVIDSTAENVLLIVGNR